MELISVRELFKHTEKYAGQEIEVGGWVRNRRPSKQFGFIMLSFICTIINKNKCSNQRKVIKPFLFNFLLYIPYN